MGLHLATTGPGALLANLFNLPPPGVGCARSLTIIDIRQTLAIKFIRELEEVGESTRALR